MAFDRRNDEAASSTRLAQRFVHLVDGRTPGKPVYMLHGVNRFSLLAKHGWILRVPDRNKPGICVTDTYKFYWYSRSRPRAANMTSVDPRHEMFIEVKLHPGEIHPSLLNDTRESYGARLYANVARLYGQAS